MKLWGQLAGASGCLRLRKEIVCSAFHRFSNTLPFPSSQFLSCFYLRLDLEIERAAGEKVLSGMTKLIGEIEKNE